jgi:tRNA (guanine37-N1)-methyltransferase
MHITVVTLFPEEVKVLGSFGVLGQAVRKGLVELETVDPRSFATDIHRTVDDRPYGGGPGMVMKVEPLRSAIQAARREAPDGTRVVVTSAQGRLFDQSVAWKMAEAPGIILVAGRYEGIDERLIELEADDEVSIGDYVLSGGELPAMVVADAVARLVPGVLGEAESARQDSFENGLLDCPHYTRPEEAGGLRVPGVLLSGDHGAIADWRRAEALRRTAVRRPDLLRRRGMTNEEEALLEEFETGPGGSGQNGKRDSG